MMLLAQCTPNPKAIAQKPQMQTHSAEGGLQRQGKARCCCMCIANCTAGTVCMMQWTMCKLQAIYSNASQCMCAVFRVQPNCTEKYALWSMWSGGNAEHSQQRLLLPAFGFSPPCFGFPQKVQIRHRHSQTLDENLGSLGGCRQKAFKYCDW